MTEFSNLTNLWVSEFLEGAQRGQLIEAQRQQLIGLLRRSRDQLQHFFGQIAATLEPGFREEFQGRLNYDLEHVRMSLEKVKAARKNVQPDHEKLSDSPPGSLLPPQSLPKAAPPRSSKEEDPFQQMFDRSLKSKQEDADKFAKDLLKQRESHHIRNQKMAEKRAEVADKISKDRRKSL